MRLGSLALSISAVVGLANCGDDGPSATLPPGLEISARTPPPNATAVETGATVTVTFSQAIDPATLTAATFMVKAGGVALPVALTYDQATRTARAAAPLLPGASYDVEVTTGVRTRDDAALDADAVWTFGTRALQAVNLGPLPRGTGTSLAVDGSGRLHVTYADSSNDLGYATCAAACVSAGNWQVITADTGNTGHYSSLAVDGSGRLHVSYAEATTDDLKYATCATTCATGANWQVVTVDSLENVGTYTSLAVDGSGRLHVTYLDAGNDDLKYATCSTACATGANWQVVTVDSPGTVGAWTSLAVEGDGRLHVSYLDFANNDLRYATCTATCATGANWQVVTVDAALDVGFFPSLAVDGSGRVHVTFYDSATDDLKYATCTSTCATGTNWQVVTVDAKAFLPSVTVDGSGRLHVSYYDFANGDLKYATCATTCAAGANWRVGTADTVGVVGQYSSLAVDGSGRLHVSYISYLGNGALRYIQ